jgi:pseudomonalisin
LLGKISCCAGALALTATAWCAFSQAPAIPSASQLDESRVVTLYGNVHPLAQPQFDQGAVSPDLSLQRMLLVLAPTAGQQAGLDALVAAQQDPASPFYHQWLTPAEFGTRFGASDQNLSQVTLWLTAHGFSIDEIAAGRRLIAFSGSAGQVFDAFHTEIHRYRIDGATHTANPQDPQIPAALAGIVRGVVSLHDFRRRSQLRERAAVNAQPQYSAGSTHYLFPADFATIYNANPLYSEGVTGSGITIAVAGRSNIELSDAASFRSLANLPANTPAITIDGADPGLVAGDQSESTLDVEWVGAVAPAATVNLVVAGSTATTDGIDVAAAYIVNHALAPVLSVSYGSCEQQMGTTELAFYNDLWEQAASQGISVFVASGDAGAAGCSAGADALGTEQAVNGLCTSPFATCVGGTEFNEGSNAAAYWSAANSAGQGSALGYIPEVVWNESATNGGSDMWASGGGASTVYPQPAWQVVVSGASAANGMRSVPDVALAAANHDGAFVVSNGSRWIASGTSIAAPEFAGLMALVIEKQHGAWQGNANPSLYAMAGGAHNPFHATPSGSNSVPGVYGFTAAGATYNLATGLGSVDAAILVNEWGADKKFLPIAPLPVRCSRFSFLSGCKPLLPSPLPVPEMPAL